MSNKSLNINRVEENVRTVPNIFWIRQKIVFNFKMRELLTLGHKATYEFITFYFRYFLIIRSYQYLRWRLKFQFWHAEVSRRS